MPNDQNAIPVPPASEAQSSALATDEATAPRTDAPLAQSESYLAQDEWAQDSELPPRPRRRLLAPAPLALLGVLLLACGFIGGVLVEKGQTSTATGGGSTGLASRLAALRGATGASGASATGGGAGSRGGFGAGTGAAGGATIGEVSYVAGNTLYVSNTEGNTVKVTTSAASSVTKTVKADVRSIHPGETVVVRGVKGPSGVLSAESISVGAGAGGGGLGALFGGGARGSSARGGATGAGGGGPSLFGE
ncbi:MAG TPA: hypothetical protein VGL57_04760 [Solirubrobacteraceae bacterium]|jgi:hypothetical protein